MSENFKVSQPMDHAEMFYKIGLNPDSPLKMKNVYNDNSLKK
jgi:hypothetical protein